MKKKMYLLENLLDNYWVLEKLVIFFIKKYMIIKQDSYIKLLYTLIYINANLCFSVHSGGSNAENSEEGQ